MRVSRDPNFVKEVARLCRSEKCLHYVRREFNAVIKDLERENVDYYIVNSDNGYHCLWLLKEDVYLHSSPEKVVEILLLSSDGEAVEVYRAKVKITKKGMELV